VDWDTGGEKHHLSIWSREHTWTEAETEVKERMRASENTINTNQNCDLSTHGPWSLQSTEKLEKLSLLPVFGHSTVAGSHFERSYPDLPPSQNSLHGPISGNPKQGL
jgi:hypothetical protein